VTEAELYTALESAGATSATMGEHAVVYLTGYLIIAYFVGAKLSSFQAGFVSFMFVVLYGSTQISLIGQIRRMDYFVDELITMGSTIPVDQNLHLYMVFGPTMAAFLAGGSLWFMWGVRHSNSAK